MTITSQKRKTLNQGSTLTAEKVDASGVLADSLKSCQPLSAPAILEMIVTGAGRPGETMVNCRWKGERQLRARIEQIRGGVMPVG
jgi:hypothetical protein